MSELFAQQETLIHSIARSLDNFKKIEKNNYTVARVKSRIDVLKETWAKCIRTHADLLKTIPVAKREMHEFRDGVFDVIEDTYQDTLDFMAECLEAINPTVRSSQTSLPTYTNGALGSSISLSHLPPINIPPFSGRCEEWESFRDRFSSLIIENKELSDFARIHFLTSSLNGRALESIRSIPITANNFQLAWNTLKSRFENKRRLIDVHVSAVCNLPSVSRESAFELSELRDKATRAITSLKNLNRSAEEMLNDILVYQVSQKLDPITRKAWKLKGGEDQRIPTYEELDRFLASRSRALEELAPPNVNKPSRASKVTSSSASAMNVISCPLCKASHFVNKCPQFVKKNPSQRFETITKANRCLNCLSAKHAVHACPSKYSCRTCQKRHHSMLHVDLASSSDSINAKANDLSLHTNSKLSAEIPNSGSVTAYVRQRNSHLNRKYY